MISHISDESIATASPVTEGESKQSARPRKLSARTFDFFRRRGSRDSVSKKEDGQGKKEELVEVKIVECKLNNAPPTKMSFDFFRNIKKHMHIKSLTMCKSKQKAKEIEVSNQSNGASTQSTLQNEKPIDSSQEICTDESKQNVPESSQVSCDREASDSPETPLPNARISQNTTEVFEQQSDTELDRTEAKNAQSINKTEQESEFETIPIEPPSCSNNETQVSHDNTVDDATIDTDVSNKEIAQLQSNISDSVTNDCKVKASLAEELLKLSKYGWYWGPISGDEADAKLISEPDGAFLVRDSSDDRYVLTLSFKSSGKLLHARMEHSGGLFSLCNQSECEGFTSVAALINHSMNFSQSAVFCYSRPKYPGYPSFPVRLTKPVSRFTQVRSLQYLCRFVIRQNTRLDNIHKLPLPNTIKGYIEEAHY